MHDAEQRWTITNVDWEHHGRKQIIRGPDTGPPFGSLDEGIEVVPASELTRLREGLDPITAAIKAESKRLAASEREAEKNRRLIQIAKDLRSLTHGDTA